jgi:DNA-directed RNA polymerase subunit RPC12/RpoP
MMGGADLFGPIFRPPRKAARVMMHVIDAGCAPGGDIHGDDAGIAVYKCRKCGHETDWTKFRTTTEATRGLPCPKCNPTPPAAAE